MSFFPIHGFILASCLLVPAPGANAAEEPGDKRVRFLASALENPVSQIDQGDVALPLLLDIIMAAASPAGFEKDAQKRVTIVIDSEAFKKETESMFDEDRVTIKFRSKLIEPRLRTVLRIICDQVDGVPLIRTDFIEIVPRAKAEKELGLHLAHDQPFPVLVNCYFTNAPLEEALKRLADRYNQNVVFAPQAESKGKTLITVRLVNVPIDTAVETLADMAELKLIRKANVLYVTTKEQANMLNGEKSIKLTTPPREKIIPK